MFGRHEDVDRVEILRHYASLPRGSPTAVPDEHAAAVHQAAQAGIRVFERDEVVLACLDVEILAGKTAEAAEVVGDGVLAENVVVEDDAELAGEAGDASELEIGLLLDDAMAVGQNFGLGGRGASRPTSSQFSATNSQSMATRSPAPGSSAGERRR